MTRISRNLNFFQRNHYSIFGIFWLLMAGFYLLSSEWGEDRTTFEFFMSGAYLIISLLYFYQAYQNRGNKGEFIEWDSESIKYKAYQGKTHSYKIGKLMSLTVATNNLIIKAPNAQGTMAPLKGYAEEDIQKLRSSFDNFNQTKQL